jgi:hypothetical protein
MGDLVRVKEEHVTTTVLQELEASIGIPAAEPILSNVAASKNDLQIFNNVSFHPTTFLMKSFIKKRYSSILAIG